VFDNYINYITDNSGGIYQNQQNARWS